MKIVYLHQYFRTPQMSGTRSYEIARRLVDSGHEVHVVTSDSDTSTQSGGWRMTNGAGVYVHWLPIPYSNSMSYSVRIRAFLGFAIRSAPRAKCLAPDVVFATSTPLTIALAAIYAAKRNRAPFVFEVRDLWSEIPIALNALKDPIAIRMARRLEKFAYRNASHIVALSPGMRQGVIDAGVDPSKVTTIPNSCDFDAFDVPLTSGTAFRQKFDWLGSRPLLVYAGTLGLVNGVGYLANVAKHALAIDPEVRFAIIGSGREQDLIRNEAESLGILNRNFFMLPPVDKASMPAIFSAATITTSTVIDKPALWHNSANKFFDSLASSRPIAINHEGWQADLIRKHGNGLVLSATDHRSAAQAIVRAVRDDDWLMQAGSNARKLGKGRFDRDNLAQQLRTILEESMI